MRLHVLTITCALVPLGAGAQIAPARPVAQTSAPATLQPDGYTYDAGGRRDPFRNLSKGGVGSGTSGAGDGEQTATPPARPAGLAGLATAEVSLRGTLQAPAGYVGLLQGADNKTYIVRPGDKLLDGTIRTITPTAMVILQRITDPLSSHREREVHKGIRQIDEAK